MSKFCTNCGQELNDVDNFCPVCGTRQAAVKSSNQAATVKSPNLETMIEQYTTSLDFTDINKISKILLKELVKIQVAICMICFSLIGLLFCLSLKADTKGIIMLMSYSCFGGLLTSIICVVIGLILSTVDFHYKFTLQKNMAMSRKTVLHALSSMGKIIDIPTYRNRHITIARCGIGFLKMNPVIICVEFIEIDNARTGLYISAYAKEGLADLRLPERAVEKLREKIR